MDLGKVLKDLREELAAIDSVIKSLDYLQGLRSPRRGRPPNWLKEQSMASLIPKKRGRPAGSKNKPKSFVQGLTVLETPPIEELSRRPKE